jgi:hypothetical protein
MQCYDHVYLLANEHDYHVTTFDMRMSVVVSIVFPPTFMQLCLSVCLFVYVTLMFESETDERQTDTENTHYSKRNSQVESFTSKLNFHRS